MFTGLPGGSGALPGSVASLAAFLPLRIPLPGSTPGDALFFLGLDDALLDEIPDVTASDRFFDFFQLLGVNPDAVFTAFENFCCQASLIP